VPQAQDAGRKVGGKDPAASLRRIELVSTNTMAADLESCTKTIRRLAVSDPDFPELTRIGNRDFARSDAWEKYEACLVQRGLKNRTKVPA
jgi:hypothetical protein